MAFSAARFLGCILILIAFQPTFGQENATPEGLEFFERRIRPILVARCYECHSAKAKSLKGGLRVDHSSGFFAGGDTGTAVVPRKPDASLLITAVRFDDEDFQMPPSGKLPDAEIALLERWVTMGAPMPKSDPAETTKTKIDFAAAREFWSFQPPLASAMPSVSDASWVARKIDGFVLNRLDEKKLQPSSRAQRVQLIRRVTFDLTGLPPTVDEVNEFLSDKSPDAYERLIDRLLASPRHGERWGRFWLDHARYTDKTASWLNLKGEAFLYRDWVVGAMNDDLPYDDFVRRQLAADMIDGLPPDELPALGFIALSPTYWKELKLAPDVIKTTVADEWEERIDALGRTFLGLTLACARCHDHKFDPISQKDYYALAGVFASVRTTDRPLVPTVQVAEVKKQQAQIVAIKNQIANLRATKKDKKAEIAALEEKIATIRANLPGVDAPTATVIEDASLYVLADGSSKTKLDYRAGQARDVPLQIRGNPSNPGEVIPRRFLELLAAKAGKFQNGSGRLELAEAIVNEGSPLAARVIVNRIWAHHFGQPLVATTSNFGTQGNKPTHPELLDDLTARFIKNGWSIKWLHRELMCSSTYQQSSSILQSEIPNPQSTDPDNHLLWRMNRRRLEIEAWRDSMLAVTDQLQSTIGGTSISLSDAKNTRRTIYGTIHRRDVDRILSLHDFPDPTGHSPKRDPTTTPLQQLFVLNSDFIQRMSSTLAVHVQHDANEPIEVKLQLIYQRLFGRMPTSDEIQLAIAFLKDGKEAIGLDAWRQYCHVLLGSNEFLFVD